MSILSLLWQNLGHGARTRQPQDEVAYPDGYRGALAHDLSLCTGCKTCAYVCSPAAITFDSAQPQFIIWQYYAGRCTYCGRCAEYCPTHAISFQDRPLGAAPDQTGHYQAHQVMYQTCSGCGQPIIPLPAPVLARIYGGALPAPMAASQALCPRCRQRAMATTMRDALHGEAKQ